MRRSLARVFIDYFSLVLEMDFGTADLVVLVVAKLAELQMDWQAQVIRMDFDRWVASLLETGMQ